MQQNGFTLIEVLFTLVLLSSLLSLAVLFSLSFYRSEGFYAQYKAIVTVLQSARTDAMSGVHGTAHGVQFLADGYVVFSGDSLANSATATRTFIPYVYPVVVSVPTNAPIVFSLRSGASVDRTIQMSDRGLPGVSTSIKINYEGFIE